MWFIIVLGFLVLMIAGVITLATGGLGLVCLILFILYSIVVVFNVKRIRLGITVCKVKLFIHN